MPEHKWERLFRTETIVSLVFAAMTVGGSILGWAEGVPWLVRIPAILLTFCAFVYLWDRVGGKVRSLVGLDVAPFSNEPNISLPSNAPDKPRLLLRVTGRHTQRTEIEDGPRGKFQILKCALMNDSDKTVVGIKGTIACRSWRSSLLSTHHDTGPVALNFDEGPITLNPHTSVHFVFFSQSTADAKIMYLGDHKDTAALKIEDAMEGMHFVTLAFGAVDMLPTFKNLVLRTFDPPKLIALEYDSRRWGHHDNSPSPMFAEDAPVQ